MTEHLARNASIDLSILKILAAAPPTIDQAYWMGYDCGLSGPDEQNCHFRLFSSPEHTKAWEQGHADAKAGQ